MTGAAPTASIARMFRHHVEARHFDTLTDLYTADALLDAHVPNWRFQVQGATAIIDELATWFAPAGRFASFDVVSTGSGDLFIEFEWREHEGTDDEIRTRELHRWRLEDGHIARQTVYCAGRWDTTLVERMASDASLVCP